MVQGYLLYPENYTKEQLKENYRDAAYNADYYADYYTVEAARAAAYDTNRAEYWLNKYFKLTGENRQDYIDEINKENNNE